MFIKRVNQVGISSHKLSSGFDICQFTGNFNYLYFMTSAGQLAAASLISSSKSSIFALSIT